MNGPPTSEARIFDEAFALTDAAERAAYLERACGGDTLVRARVEKLLAASENAGSFLEPLPNPNPTLRLNADFMASGEKPGDVIGNYKLREKIGEGGCGEVYVADQEKPVRRRVALKIIKLGMATKEVVARFEAERQALALMDHPNIAKVLDAGATSTGRPFFVMELVRGIKITDYCDQNKLSTEERLKLFIQVCHAVQHAHQKGIIHRDIKPSNILVTLHDGVPVPKVIDFGIAKAISNQRLTDKTIYTAFEQFIGTPAYMSPEQAEMSGLDIDTRSDIYSLGVLLYELLTGRTPFDAATLLKAGLDQMRRIIREQEPQRPSTRLSTLDDADLTAVAEYRRAEAPKLLNLIRGDLDWIVMKSLEKDRTRRYETANGLATEIQRHLSNEPIIARPPSTLYRTQKLVQRNKLAVAIAFVIVIALVCAIAIVTGLLVRERKARVHAIDAEKAQEQLKQEAELNKLRKVAHDLEQRGQFSDAASVYRKIVAKESSTDALYNLGRLINWSAWNGPRGPGGIRRTNELPDAEQALRQVLARLRKLPNGKSKFLADVLHCIGDSLELQGRLAEAEAFQRESFELQVKFSGWGDPEVFYTLYGLERALRYTGKIVEADKLLAQNLEIIRKSADTKNTEAERMLVRMFTRGQGVARDEKEAAVWLKRIAERYRPEAERGNPQSLNALAWTLATCKNAQVRDGSNAVRYAEKAVEITKREDPRILDTLAAALAEIGQFEQAVHIQQEAIKLVNSEGEQESNGYLSRLKLYEANLPFHDLE